jgi:hypothetical protein
MKVLESPSGQAAENFADALFRNIMADGRNTLEVLHRESFIKKVPCNQVIMTPTSKAKVRLDELNNILNEMKQGEEAIKRLSELDAGAGMSGKVSRARQGEGREVGAPANSRSKPATITESVLSDDDLAAQRIEQAAKMRASAEALLAEAERLTAEAGSFGVSTVKAKKTNVKKTKVQAH